MEDDDKIKIFDYLKQVPQENWDALYTCAITCVFIASVSFSIIQLSSKASSYFKYPFFWHGMICEVSSTFFYCTSFYTNEIVLRYFGYPGMFISIFVHMVIYQRVYKEHGKNMLILTDEYTRLGDTSIATWVIPAQLMASFASKELSLFLVGDEIKLFGEVDPKPCLLPHLIEKEQTILPYVFLMEALGGAVFHLIHRHYNGRIESTAFFYAMFFTASHAITGVFSGQPNIFCSRINTCPHILVPVLGWNAVPLLTKQQTNFKTIWRIKFEEEQAGEARGGPAEAPKQQNKRGGNNNRGFGRGRRGGRR